jgi:small nuclear ribonucleoprotein (snRNP)-like protein
MLQNCKKKKKKNNHLNKKNSSKKEDGSIVEKHVKEMLLNGSNIAIIVPGSDGPKAHKV